LSPATEKLFEAVNRGDLAKVQISIDDGANYKAVNSWGITPVDLAVDKGHTKIIHYLLKIIEIQTQKEKLTSKPTPSKATSTDNPTKALASVEPNPSVANGLSAVAEVYSPPSDSGPWSATVVTVELPSNMKVANVNPIIEKNKSSLNKTVRKFPQIDPVQPVTKSQSESAQIDQSKDEDAKRQQKPTLKKNRATSRKKELQQAKVLPMKPARKSKRKLPEKKLKGITFKIGQVAALNKALPPQTSPPKFYQSCIYKKLGSLIFCIENLNWPDSIRSFFLTDSILSEDTHTIVRYDRGEATYFHTLFPSKSYTHIINFFTQRFGAPTQKIERSIAPLAEKRRNNPTAIWESITPTTNLLTTLEIRMYDDNRGDFPDTKHGAIYLYHEKSQSVFPHVSMVELMLLRAEKN
jgi:hypothetical protein